MEGQAMSDDDLRQAMADAARIYIASKAKHGDRWRYLRDTHAAPFISTWIEESGAGQTTDWPGLWSRCVREAAGASALVVYREPGEELKGAWIEVGAALASGVPVFAVGCSEFSIRHHPMFTECVDIGQAIAAAEAVRREREPDCLVASRSLDQAEVAFWRGECARLRGEIELVNEADDTPEARAIDAQRRERIATERAERAEARVSVLEAEATSLNRAADWNAEIAKRLAKRARKWKRKAKALSIRLRERLLAGQSFAMAPTPDADGWIEWTGEGTPPEGMVRIRHDDGWESDIALPAEQWGGWDNGAISHYRPSAPETPAQPQVEPTRAMVQAAKADLWHDAGIEVPDEAMHWALNAALRAAQPQVAPAGPSVCQGEGGENRNGSEYEPTDAEIDAAIEGAAAEHILRTSRQYMRAALVAAHKSKVAPAAHPEPSRPEMAVYVQTEAREPKPEYVARENGVDWYRSRDGMWSTKPTRPLPPGAWDEPDSIAWPDTGLDQPGETVRDMGGRG
jgi:hypothetical protein